MRTALLILTLIGVSLSADSAVQTATAQSPSPRGAFFRSLVLPGWGHKYAHGGNWGTSGTLFASADVAMLLGAGNAAWRENSVEESYRTLAASRAGADLDGKNRTFFLRLASYISSDEFLEVSLRNRAWSDINYVSDPSFQWRWASEADYLEYRDLRDESESLGRRRTILIATLVANRLISGLSAARAASRGQVSGMELGLEPVPGQSAPLVRMAIRY